jgi:predicted transcriptional regulator of viral defense system
MTHAPRNNNTRETQSDRARALLNARGMMRLSEFAAEGIAATTVSRMAADGVLVRLSRGVYQLADAPIEANHDLAEAAKRVPKGVICLTSALAYHGLTDQIPRRVWMAIGLKDWTPGAHGPRLRLLRMSDHVLQTDIEIHRIENVTVRMFTIPRTLVDCFRFRKSVGLNVAVEALREALRQRKTTPAEIARLAQARGVWRFVSPYLEAFTIDG